MLSLPPERPLRVIDAPEALAAFAERLEHESLLALDTESNSLHAYREQVCTVQLTTASEDVVVDPLTALPLTPLTEALARDELTVVVHGGDYDVASLSRDFGVRLQRIFDTMIAATLLGEEQVGLAALVERHYGVQLDKRFQRADWKRRPLTHPMLEYLRRDTIYLPGLHAHFRARLRDADLEEEAEIEFRRVAARAGPSPSVDPEKWRRLKGANGLGERGRAVLQELFAWREEEARRLDRPPFKVLSPAWLVRAAQSCESASRTDDHVQWLSPRERRRFGAAVRAATWRGLREAAAGRAPSAKRAEGGGDSLSREERQRRKRLDEVLRQWRRREAAARGVPNMVVLPNPALVWLVEGDPRSARDLATCADIGPKRIARYGDAIMRLLRGTKAGATESRERNQASGAEIQPSQSESESSSSQSSSSQSSSSS